METHFSTTPFGRRPMTLGMISSQVTARAVSKDATVHKWHVFQDIKDARIALGASDRALAILDALLSFHPDTALYGDSELIVWPSNEQLIRRANGMPPTTLRRHLAVLVECGLIIRRDSPNGKRFARKGQGGEIEQAYGFDISPIVARAEEFKELAEAVRSEKKAFRLVKERLTICRRDIVKMIDAGIEEGVPANWGRVQQAYQAIVGQIPRTAPRQTLEAIAEDLEGLWAEVREALESFVKRQKVDANESQNGRHIQNSKPDSKSESENGLGNKDEAGGNVADTDNIRSLPKRELPLGIVLDACPNMLWLVKGGGGIRNWREFLAAAEVARPAMGISPSAWEEARTAMGEQQAAITIAAIYQRQDQINSAGGYLRSLTDRAKAGKFSVWPMVMALLRAKLDASKTTGTGAEAAAVDLETAGKIVRTESRLEISDALRRSLDKPGRGS
ncbi:replication initiation protein RepC (plasmid) [Mesorhizobium mediterraneum]|uniref:Replication initiation protein RepC n=3 Tax=Mesorhizobium TaxID=68287 RepID=A0AB36RHA7_9HYPH|nr:MULTISPECIES: plasmid replication protein RepC [Mesorhizobium]PAQ04283.1 replication initiation protein RepC [Mesorhizobium mediterraneum]RUU85194.1 replication initiation protein RepC [Mesorhizobium sp. M7A.F.Ca.MR.176.00.0.0]RWA99572.1 MAG: replication initiation protein RepC [Mesorhizobium sp.]RWB09437.1 MAG: replication initiation protein RepC [Mesorhizobium sp.]RWN24233.1 MAG: replication initiation protein RepC [Mesorhizobium sp.]